MKPADGETVAGVVNGCDCSSGRAYEECCRPFIDGESFPERAEQLMRSRFTAYRRGEVDYLVETTHPNARGKRLREEILETLDQISWISLTVESTNLGGAGDKIGKVEFVAEYRHDDEVKTHREKSRFRRFDGRWKYFDDRG